MCSESEKRECQVSEALHSAALACASLALLVLDQGCRLLTAEAADPSNFHRTTTNSFLSGGKAIRHRKILSILGCQHFKQTMSSIRGFTVKRSFASRKTLRICHSQRLPARRRGPSKAVSFVCAEPHSKTDEPLNSPRSQHSTLAANTSEVVTTGGLQTT